MSKKGFTLIEVLVAVVILSSVAVLLFEINTNSKNSFSFLRKKSDFIMLSSLPIMHSNYKYHNKSMSIYEFIKDQYDIKDNDLIDYLKREEVHFSYKEFSSFSPLGEGTLDSEMPNFQIVFDKVEVYNKTQSSWVYKIYMRVE